MNSQNNIQTPIVESDLQDCTICLFDQSLDKKLDVGIWLGSGLDSAKPNICFWGHLGRGETKLMKN